MQKRAQMNLIFAILFGIPSFIILAILAYVGVVGTLINVLYAIKIKDYDYIASFLILTILAAALGWFLGGIL